MKPNRRYGFQYLGSRSDFTTRLLFGVDVSGSMGGPDLGIDVMVMRFLDDHRNYDGLRFRTGRHPVKRLLEQRGGAA